MSGEGEDHKASKEQVKRSLQRSVAPAGILRPWLRMAESAEKPRRACREVILNPDSVPAQLSACLGQSKVIFSHRGENSLLREIMEFVIQQDV